VGLAVYPRIKILFQPTDRTHPHVLWQLPAIGYALACSSAPRVALPDGLLVGCCHHEPPMRPTSLRSDDAAFHHALERVADGTPCLEIDPEFFRAQACRMGLEQVENLLTQGARPAPLSLGRGDWGGSGWRRGGSTPASGCQQPVSTSVSTLLVRCRPLFKGLD